MKIKITIIDDQPVEISRLNSELQKWNSDHKFAIEILEYSSGEEYFQKEKIHDSSVFFLDIHLNGMDGLSIAKKLRSKGYPGYLIFLTAFREYAFEGYQVHALNFLLKPVHSASLYPCMDEIAKELSGNTYVFRNKQEIIQIPYNDILTFSSNMHYVDILTISDTFSQYAALNNIIPYLPKEFIQTHRSYIVNMSHIYKIIGNKIVLSNNLNVQIGRSYLKQVKTAISDYSVRFN